MCVRGSKMFATGETHCCQGMANLLLGMTEGLVDLGYVGVLIRVF